MSEAETAKVLGVSPQEVAAFFAWLAYWSARHVPPENMPIAATVAPPPSELAFKPAVEPPQEAAEAVEPPPPMIPHINSYVKESVTGAF